MWRTDGRGKNGCKETSEETGEKMGGHIICHPNEDTCAGERGATNNQGQQAEPGLAIARTPPAVSQLQPGLAQEARQFLSLLL